MPRTKKTTEPEVSPVAATEQPKRKRATTTKSSPAAKSTTAAPHKHTTKKAAQPAESVSEQPTHTVTTADIARLAYSYWEARGYQGGSPEADWLRAEQELLVLAQNR